MQNVPHTNSIGKVIVSVTSLTTLSPKSKRCGLLVLMSGAAAGLGMMRRSGEERVQCTSFSCMHILSGPDKGLKKYCMSQEPLWKVAALSLCRLLLARTS